jgi:hypothetical protein
VTDTFKTSTGIELQLKPMARKKAFAIARQMQVLRGKSEKEQADLIYPIFAEVIDAGVILDLTPDQVALAQLARQAFNQVKPGMGNNKSDKFFFIQSNLPEPEQLWTLTNQILQLTHPNEPAPAQPVNKPNTPKDPLALFKRPGKPRKK